MDRDVKLNHKATIKDIDATDKAFFRMIAPSILGIFVCMICLVTLTWAWYSEGTETVTVIEAANYSATVHVTEMDGGASVAPDQLMAGIAYAVEVKTNATDNTIGFCEVRINDLVFVAGEADVAFTLIPDSDHTALKVDALWGSAIAVYPRVPELLVDQGSYKLENGALKPVDAAGITETEDGSAAEETETEEVEESETADE